MTTSISPIGQLDTSKGADRARRLMICCLFVGAFLVVGTGFGLFLESSSLLKATHLVIKTQTTITELENTLSLMKDAETGQRGFLLTGKTAYLKPYEMAPTAMAAGIKRLEKLLAHQPDELALLTKAENSIDKKLAELKLTVDLRQTSGMAAALNEVQSDKGIRFMGEIRQLFGQIESDQRSLLVNSLEVFESNTNVTISLFASFVASSGILFGAFAILLGRYIAEMRSAHQLMARQSTLLSSILNSISDGVCVADTNGKFLLVNPSAEKITSIQGIDTPAEKWSDVYGLFKSDGTTPYAEADVPLVRATRGEAVDDEELLINNPTLPHPIWVNVSGRPLTDPATSEAIGGVVVFRDITERKEAQNRLSEFYAILSHELRTPLTSIRGSMDLIDGGVVGELSQAAKELITISRTETERMLRLINELLDLSAIEAGKLKLRFSSIACSELVVKALEGVQGFAAETKVTLVHHINTDAAITCDTDRIRQVLANLLSNALKFSYAGKNVHLTVDAGPQSTVRFSIKDEGVGIPKNQFSHVFQKFQQTRSSSSARYKGTGLGLPISKSIVEQHGGQIGFESEEGVGSTFWFTIPTEQPDARATEVTQ